MHFVTVTLNPALDCTVRVAGSLTPGAVHSVVGERVTPGGKGINVAMALAAGSAYVEQAGKPMPDMKRVGELVGTVRVRELKGKLP